MTAIEDRSSRSFHPSMLLSDQRYRSLTFQALALAIFIALLGWLVSNTVHNLAVQGKTFNYGYLNQAAGFDINQYLIPYTTEMTNGRAILVGALNTLLVAFLGCIAATICGVGAGVLRLSSNWLVAKVAAAYVEIFRNIPVLIVILTIYAIMSETMPAPRAFRGEDATASMLLWDSVAITNRGVYVPRPVWNPGSTGVVIVFLAAVVGAWFYGRRNLAQRNATGDAPRAWPIQLAIVILPTLAAFLALGRPIGLDFPQLSGFNFTGGMQLSGSLIALWFALSIYTGAFIAENVRAGIQAVSRGQSEAAASLGLTPGRTMRLVVLPQALRVIVPPLISHYLNLTKNTSLAMAVGYMDLTAITRVILNQTGRGIEAVLLLMGFYLVISLMISALMNWYNRSIRLMER